LVCAGAGHGKTTLLVDFASDVEAPVCWYSLDTFDSDMRTFLETFTEAIRYKFPGFGNETREHLGGVADMRRGFPAVVKTLTSEIHRDIPEFFVVVLDDYHYIETNPDINRMVDYLLERLPENCRLIISSRVSPQLSAMPRLRTQNDAAILNTRDLCFSPEEVEDLFFVNYGLSLEDAEIRKLLDESEGWVTGVLLLGSSHRKPLFLGQAEKAEDKLFQYLAAETYCSQPDKLQLFLLRTSILSELVPENCNSLLGIKGSKKILERLERENLFVERLEYSAPVYRYHHLFQHFLQKRLSQDSPTRYAALNLKAAMLYEKKRDWEKAVHHYARGQHWKECIRVISTIGEQLVAGGRWEVLAQWIDRIPLDEVTEAPELLVWRAQAALRPGELHRALGLASQALELARKRQMPLLIGKAALVRAAALRLAGQEGDALRDVREAQKLLRRGPGPPPLVAEAHRQLGSIMGQRGKFQRARNELKRSLSLFMKAGDLRNISKVNDLLGIAYAELGDFPQAMNHFEQAKTGWEKLGNFSELGQTLNNQGNLYHLQGNCEEGLQVLEKAVEADRKTGNLRAEGWALWTMADILRDLGDYDTAIKTYEKSLAIAREGMEAHLIGYATCNLGTVYGLRGQFEKAEFLMKQAISQAQETNSKYELGLFLGNLGILDCQRGKCREGMKHLLQSIDLVGPFWNRRELARLHSHLANAYFLGKQFHECDKQLEKAVAILDELGFDDFLLADVSRMSPLIEYAASKRLGDGRFLQLRRKVIARQAQGHKMSSEPHDLSGKPTLPKVEAFALGQAAVLIDGRKVTDTEWRSKKSKELFFYLLSHRQGAKREQIFDALWPEVIGAKCNSCFYTTVYRLRKALYDECLKLENERYCLNNDGEFWFDAVGFQRVLEMAERLPRGSQSRADCLERAIQMYKGGFLEEFYSEWCQTIRRNLEEKYLNSLASLAGYYAGQGDYAKCVDLLEQVLNMDSYREEAWAELMKVHARMGDFNAALQCYRRYAQLAETELQYRPSPEMTDLYQEILSMTIKGQ
jgi:LuxR family maltose regulon positive regulatory protein